MVVVSAITLPIWANSQPAPSDTQLPRALSTLLAPNPTTLEATEAVAWVTPGDLTDRAQAGTGQRRGDRRARIEGDVR